MSSGNSHFMSCSFSDCCDKLFVKVKGEMFMNQESVGKFLASLRKEKRLTQEQLAEMLGVNSRSVSRWENGYCMRITMSWKS